jgi:hypothetical protein
MGSDAHVYVFDAEIAAQERRGILWGNDLPSHDWKDHSWRTMRARHQMRTMPP